MLKQLSDQHASFLYAETAETPMHVGSLSLVELPEGYRGDFFADYKQLARHTATKVNDVVVAVCSGALRSYLVDKGALPIQAMTAMIPVSIP